MNDMQHLGLSLFFGIILAVCTAQKASTLNPVLKSLMAAGSPSQTSSGLINLSNTCYLNSVIQCLTSLKKFRSRLLEAEVKKNSIGQEVKALLRKLVESSGQPVKPYGLVSSLEIDIDVQEDAEELLLRLLNEVEEHVVSTAKPTDSIKFKTLQRIVCVRHDHANEKTCTNFDLSVDFRGCSSLEEALDKHFEGELLDGENMYHCSVHGLQPARKSLHMLEFPQTLVIHLKRFSFDPSSGIMKKVGDTLQIPAELDLSSYGVATSSDSDEAEQPEERYFLSGVVIHEGNLQAGHYYSAVKESHADKEWTLFNDHVVQRVDEESVLRVAAGIEPRAPLLDRYGKLGERLRNSATGYLLFYTRME